MRIQLTIPERIAEEAERLARQEGTPVSSFYAHAVEEYVKEACTRSAIEHIDALLGAGRSERGDERSRARS